MPYLTSSNGTRRWISYAEGILYQHRSYFPGPNNQRLRYRVRVHRKRPQFLPFHRTRSGLTCWLRPVPLKVGWAARGGGYL